MAIRPVILSGGSGTRLWPASRKSLPKQFIEFPGTGSLFARTLERATAISGGGNPLIISSKAHGFLCRRAASGLGLTSAVAITQEELDELQETVGMLDDAAKSSTAAEQLEEGDQPGQIRRLTGRHYRFVRQIVTEMVDPPDSAFQRTGLSRAVSCDGHVEWVLERDIGRFEMQGRACLHASYREVQSQEVCNLN